MAPWPQIVTLENQLFDILLEMRETRTWLEVKFGLFCSIFAFDAGISYKAVPKCVCYTVTNVMGLFVHNNHT